MPSPTDLHIKPNRGIALLVALPWLIPILLAWQLPTALTGLSDLTVRLVLVSLVLLLAWRSARLTRLLQHPYAVVRLHEKHNQLYVTLRNGDQHPVRVRGWSRISARFVWLAITERKRQHCVLLSAHPGFCNADPATLRRFSVWLRLSPAASTADNSALSSTH